MFLFRDQLDCKAHRTSASGAGYDKNDVILPNYDIEIEAKNRKGQFALSEDWQQLKRQKTGRMNVLAIRNPKKPEFEETIIAMTLGDFIKLVKGKNKPAVIEMPKDMKWRVKKLEQSAKDVFKYLNTKE